MKKISYYITTFKLEKFRELNNITQEEMSEMLGINTTTTYRNYEKGRTMIPADKLVMFMQICNLHNIDDIVEEKQIEENYYLHKFKEKVKTTDGHADFASTSCALIVIIIFILILHFVVGIPWCAFSKK